jgi:hypothetical protein
MATNKNLVIDQGATFSANIQFLNTNKNPISLAGYSVRSKMRTSYDAANAAVLVASVTDAANGNVNLFLQSANTSLLPQGRYVYDVEAYTGNDVIRIVEGAITVSPGVSGDHVGSILKQTINSLVNGSYTVALAANGIVSFPAGITINGNANILGTVFGTNFSGNGALLTNIVLPGDTFVSNNYISKATLKSIVANSDTYAAFQANIAAL